MSFHSYMIIEGEKLFSLKSYKNLKKIKKVSKKADKNVVSFVYDYRGRKIAFFKIIQKFEKNKKSFKKSGQKCRFIRI